MLWLAPGARVQRVSTLASELSLLGKDEHGMQDHSVCGRVRGLARLHVARRAVLHTVEAVQRASGNQAARKQE